MKTAFINTSKFEYTYNCIIFDIYVLYHKLIKKQFMMK